MYPGKIYRSGRLFEVMDLDNDLRHVVKCVTSEIMRGLKFFGGTQRINLFRVIQNQSYLTLFLLATKNRMWIDE